MRWLIRCIWQLVSGEKKRLVTLPVPHFTTFRLNTKLKMVIDISFQQLFSFFNVKYINFTFIFSFYGNSYVVSFYSRNIYHSKLSHKGASSVQNSLRERKANSFLPLIVEFLFLFLQSLWCIFTLCLGVAVQVLIDTLLYFHQRVDFIKLVSKINIHFNIITWIFSTGW